MSELPFNTKTALAVVFPNHEWIQAVREANDAAFARWMPHVNLAFPFVGPEHFDELVPRIAEALADVEAFEVDMGHLSFFKRKKDMTFHLSPLEGAENLVHIFKIVKDCLPEVQFRRPDFQPHLTLGQCKKRDGPDMLQELTEQMAGESLRFLVREICVIQRDADTPFKVVHRIKLK
jgi:2'-5' RNA ligase